MPEEQPAQEGESRTVPQHNPGVSGWFCEAPEKSTTQYGRVLAINQRRCSEHVNRFFNDSVQRARERNIRYEALVAGCWASPSQYADSMSVVQTRRQHETEKRLQQPNISRLRREQIWCAAGQKEAQYLRFLRTKDRPENYETIKLIGKGAFGEVKLVRQKKNSQVYAMKSLVKTEMLRRDQLAHVRSERDVLAEAESPWVVKLFTTFQDAYFLYMIMEFLPGGDMMTMLIKYEIFSEPITRFYMAELILAIEAVHKLGYIHRYV